MDEDFKQIFEGLVSTDGPVAINLVEKRDPNLTTHVIKHVLRNGTGVIRKKRTLSTASARTSDENYSGARSVRSRRRTTYYEFRIDRCCLRGLLR